jgi:hypothetical protein
MHRQLENREEPALFRQALLENHGPDRREPANQRSIRRLAIFPGTNQLLRSSLHLARGKACRNRSTVILSNENRASAPGACCFCGTERPIFSAMRHQSSLRPERSETLKVHW